MNQEKSLHEQLKLSGGEIAAHIDAPKASVAAAALIVPRHVLGGPGYTPPSDLLNMGCIAVGGKGMSDIEAVGSQNLIAVCDVDDNRYDEFRKQFKDNAGLLAKFEKANKYRDFREMLEKEKEIEAVTISTPDHTHAVAAMMAIKMGKHVFCQKPLTHTIYEARRLAQAAKEANVATQMGNQGHASESTRILCEWIRAGAIGDVTEVHCFTDRPLWAQAQETPIETPFCPPFLDWNLWLGPARYRPYHRAYVPWRWRGWFDFGTGAIGDMGAHILDAPYWALELGAPLTVQASCTKFTEVSYPQSSIVKYTFAARGKKPAVDLYWYDGGLMPARPEELEPGRLLGGGDGGVLFIGSKGKLMCGTYGENPRLIPEKKMNEFERPEKTIPRSPGIALEWIEAAKSGKKSTTDFSYSGPLTECMLLGNLAIRLKEKNTILHWDHANMKVTNLAEANQLLHFEYRQGWEL